MICLKTVIAVPKVDADRVTDRAPALASAAASKQIIRRVDMPTHSNTSFLFGFWRPQYSQTHREPPQVDCVYARALIVGD